MSHKKDRAKLIKAYSLVNEDFSDTPIVAVTSMDSQMPEHHDNECGCTDCGGEDHDHSEIHMAKAELKKAAEYAIKLSEMLDNMHGLEGWTASKITKASDYLSSVYHWLDYEMHDNNQPDTESPQGMYNVGAEDGE